MRISITFYLFVVAMALLDAVLLRSPNLLGKIGLIIYKYHYLRTFPRALLTVSLVVGMSVIISELIRLMVRKEKLKRYTGKLLLTVLILLAAVLLVNTGMDFSSGAYSQTGLRFRIGACLLPAILMNVFVYYWITLPTIAPAPPENPAQP